MPAKKPIQVGDERIYVVPLRREWQKVPNYRRTEKAVKALKQFLAKHLRVEDRDTSKIKLDHFVNEEIWFRGSKNPVHKIKVKVKKIKEKDKEFFKVSLVDIHEVVKYRMARENKLGKEVEKVKKEKKVEEKKEEETEEKKEETKEKEETSKEATQAIEKAEHKAMKHQTSGKHVRIQRKIQRKALQK